MLNLDVIVPLKNEAPNIKPLVERISAALSKANIAFRLILVDDWSTDATVEQIKKLKDSYPIILHKKIGKPGKAYCILEGAELAESENLAMLDADLQYPPEIIPQMLEKLSQHGVVVARRKVYKSTMIRKIASRSIALVFGRLLFGLKTDVQSGLKVFKREIIEHLDKKVISAWALDIPLLFTAQELGYSIGSVDIVFERRKSGESKINHVHNAIEIAVSALRQKLKRKKIYHLPPQDKNTMKGAGLVHRRKRFITHTTLSPAVSALIALTKAQQVILLALAATVLFGLIADRLFTAIIITAVLSSIYFIDVLFNLYLIIKSLKSPPDIKFSQQEIKEVDDNKLPVYSILVPLYLEAHIVGQFISALSRLDWPKNKLDVQLILETDDRATVEEVKKMSLPQYVRITVVPLSHPKTKPKACNFGLAHAKGEYIVIYDAEDIPDPLQLKKAYLAFSKTDKSVICLQAKLNYYNPHHNLLTRFFTAEYSLWFDIVLNGLQSISTTIPLGGTSNHFKTKDLLFLKGWDPFNVTEDCDLGVRLFKSGFKTAIIDSTTLEEANSNFKNWLRQRSRWIKGYIQTYFVHMRNPLKLVRELGIHALLFQLIVGGKIAFMLINPFLWVATIAYFTLFAYVGPAIEAVYPQWVFYMAAFSLAFGNFLFMYYYMIGVAKRGHWSLMKYVLLVPFYWLMVSLGAGMAIIQFIVNPHYWEKTIHGFHLNKKTKEDPALKPQTAKQYRKRFFLGSIWDLPIGSFTAGSVLVAASVIGNIFNFLYNAYLGRILNVEQFGLVTLFSSLFYLSQVAFSSLGSTVTFRTGFLSGKYDASVKSFWRRVRNKSFIVAVFATAIWILAIPALSRFFRSDSFLPFVIFTPVWLLGILASVNGGFLSGNLKFYLIALIVVLEASIKFAVSVLLISLGLPHLVYAAVPIALSVSMLTGWLAVVTMKEKKISVPAGEIAYFPKRFFASSVLSKLASVGILTLDVLLVKHFLPPATAGEYALLSLVGKMIFFLGSLFSQFITPLISRAEGAGRNSEKIFYRLILATLLVTIFGFLAVGVFGDITVPLLLGQRARPIVVYLLMYSLAFTYITVASSIVSYHQVKRQYVFAVASFIMAGLEMVGIILFHDSIITITQTVLAVGTVYLLSMIFMHVYYRRLYFLFRNSEDFVGLFKKIPAAAFSPSLKLKILIFNWRDTRHVWAGGAEVYIHELGKRWVKEGNQVTVFCGNDGHQSRNQVIDGVQIVRRGGFYMVYFWAFLYYILKFRGHYDVVIDSANGVPFFTPLFVRKPVFLLIHHVHQNVFRQHLRFPLKNIAVFVESKLMPFVYQDRKVVTVSQSSKKDILASKIVQSKNVEVIHPGVDLNGIKRAEKTGYPSFLYIGRLKPYKNIDVTIKAFAKVLADHPNARFTIAGEGESMPSLQNLADKLSMNSHVEFLGKVTEEEKIRLLSRSWVVLQPSSFEGWGITVIEANAAGTPVIASNVNGLRDSVVYRKTGILVPVKQVNAFAAAMDSLITLNGYRRNLSKEALAWSKTFNWDDSAKKFYNIITHEISRNRLPLAHEFAVAKS